MFIILLRGISYVVAVIVFGWLGYMVGGLKGAVTGAIVGLVIRFFFDVGVRISVEYMRKREWKDPVEFLDSLTPEKRARFQRTCRIPLPEIQVVRTVFSFYEFIIWGFGFILFCRFAQLGNPDRFLACVAPIRPLMGRIHSSFPYFAEYLVNSPRSGDAVHVAVAEVVGGGLVIGFAAMIVISVGYFAAGWNEHVRRFELSKGAFDIKKENYERGIVLLILPVIFSALTFTAVADLWGAKQFVLFSANEIPELGLNIPSSSSVRSIYWMFFGASMSLGCVMFFFLTQMYFVLMRLTKFPDSEPIPTKDTGV